MLEALKTLWRLNKRLIHFLNAAIAWLLMSVAYVLALGPVALYLRVSRQVLLDRAPPSADPESRPDSYWRPLPALEEDIRRAQRPW